MHLLQRCIVRPIVLIAVLLACNNVFATTTMNIHWQPDVRNGQTQFVHALNGDNISGNIWVNVVNTDYNAMTMDVISFSQAWYKENAHDAPQVNLSLNSMSTCPLCTLPFCVARSQDSSVPIVLAHNASYDFHVSGTVTHTLMWYPYTQTSEPFDIPMHVTAKSLALTSWSLPYLLAWDPAQGSNLNLFTYWDDAQQGTCSLTYTIGGQQYQYINKNRPGNDMGPLTISLTKGLYSTAVSLMSNPPTASGDGNRSGYLTVSDTNAIPSMGLPMNYEIWYKLKDTGGLNASKGNIYLYDPALNLVESWDILSGLTAYLNATLNSELIDLSNGQLDRAGIYKVAVQCWDSHHNNYKTHTDRPAYENICNIAVPSAAVFGSTSLYHAPNAIMAYDELAKIKDPVNNYWKVGYRGWAPLGDPTSGGSGLMIGRNGLDAILTLNHEVTQDTTGVAASSNNVWVFFGHGNPLTIYFAATGDASSGAITINNAIQDEAAHRYMLPNSLGMIKLAYLAGCSTAGNWTDGPSSSWVYPDGSITKRFFDNGASSAVGWVGDQYATLNWAKFHYIFWKDMCEQGMTVFHSIQDAKDGVNSSPIWYGRWWLDTNILCVFSWGDNTVLY